MGYEYSASVADGILSAEQLQHLELRLLNTDAA